MENDNRSLSRGKTSWTCELCLIGPCLCCRYIYGHLVKVDESARSFLILDQEKWQVQDNAKADVLFEPP